MTITSDMAAAFHAGAGWDAGPAGTAIVLVVGAFAVVWGANALRSVSQLAMDKRMELPRALRYVLRALVLVMLLIYLMS